MVQCPNCGAMNPDSAEKCEKCREGLMPGKTEVIIHETPKLPFIKRAPFRKGQNS
ncbi:MAG: zinc-ribbon domain-containing protein [Firmicutes bacterium]|nr:zinc-ribbon domain-containing protein [Bacillota bacterium]